MNERKRRWPESYKQALIRYDAKRRKDPAYKEWKSRYSAKRRIERQSWLNSLKEGKPCTDCKQVFPFWCMDYDHLPQYKKHLAVSLMVGRGTRIEKIVAEIKKCELVCANCHRNRTYQRLANRQK